MQQDFHKSYKIDKKVMCVQNKDYFMIQHTLTKQFFTAKVEKKKNARGLRNKRQLEDELKLTKVMHHHPHVMQLLDVYETENSFIQVMQNIQGNNLAEYIDDRFTINKFKNTKILTELIMAVEFMHS